MSDNINTSNQSFMNAFAAGDATALAGLYTTDGQLAPPNSDVVTGHEAIGGFWQGAMDMGLKGVTLETAELDEYGDTAVEQGRYQLTDGEGNVADRGKYMVLWKRDGDTWKLHRDIWNTSMPGA